MHTRTHTHTTLTGGSSLQPEHKRLRLLPSHLCCGGGQPPGRGHQEWVDGRWPWDESEDTPPSDYQGDGSVHTYVHVVNGHLRLPCLQRKCWMLICNYCDSLGTGLYQWTLLKPSVDTHSCCVRYAQLLCEIRTAAVWDTHSCCVRYAQLLCEIRTAAVWDTHSCCVRYAQLLCEICIQCSCCVRYTL